MTEKRSSCGSESHFLSLGCSLGRMHISERKEQLRLTNYPFPNREEKDWHFVVHQLGDHFVYLISFFFKLTKAYSSLGMCGFHAGKVLEEDFHLNTSSMKK